MKFFEVLLSSFPDASDMAMVILPLSALVGATLHHKFTVKKAQSIAVAPGELADKAPRLHEPCGDVEVTGQVPKIFYP